MKFQRFKPFVLDLISSFLIIVIVIGAFVVSGYVNINIELNVLTVAAIIIVFLYLMRILNNTVITGLKGLFDFIFKKTVIIKGKFISIIPLRRSSVSSTRINGKYYTPEYYKIVIESDDKMFSIISSNYVELNRHIIYEFEIGKYSSILLSYL